ncbi:hypothetical protein LTS18_005820 [Coniosporium uncinatum]|uniref:Uncharacterized protein n=1 Tax=Coniosporium uncinatum TaxID=93489 RepID=A0ACC3DYW2_9PEZI|nr:hypothetical protein LTS18_005820 [Coniosporium uncinatum]
MNSGSTFLPTHKEIEKLVHMLKDVGMLDRLENLLQEIRPTLKDEITDEIELTNEQATQWSQRIRDIMVGADIIPEDVEFRSDEQEAVAQELVEKLGLGDVIEKLGKSARLKHRIARSIVAYFRGRDELTMTK